MMLAKGGWGRVKAARWAPGAGIGMALYGAAILLVIGLTVWRCSGEFTYSLDDPYIHMAVAKHFVQHGVWGATKYEPSSSISSILWPLLLAAIYRMVGVTDLAPLILNILLGGAFLVCLAEALRRYGIDEKRARVLVPVIVFMSYIIPNIFDGMEHVLQCLASFVFVIAAVDVLAGGRPAWRLAVLAPLVTASRYEGLFLVAIVCGLLMVRRRLLPALAVGLCAWAPLIVYGLIMMRLGFPFFPHSVLIKANPDLPFLGGPMALYGPRFVSQLLLAPDVLALSICLAMNMSWLRKRKAAFWSKPVLLHVIVLGCILLHLEFASVASAFRYHAYLVMLGVFTLAVTHGPIFQSGLNAAPGRRKAALAILILSFGRAAFAFATIPLAAGNIHQQQFQMARFLNAYYPTESVALNDIGAIAFYTDVHIVDCAGLATPEVAKARLAGHWSFDTMDSIVRRKHAKLAIIYSYWFSYLKGFPGLWVPVRHWRISWNVTCGSRDIDFYVVDPREKDALVQYLDEFAPFLPSGVGQAGLYANGDKFYL